MGTEAHSAWDTASLDACANRCPDAQTNKQTNRQSTGTEAHSAGHPHFKVHLVHFVLCLHNPFMPEVIFTHVAIPSFHSLR